MSRASPGDAVSIRGSGMWLAFKQVGPYAFFILIPAVVIVIFATDLSNSVPATDFRYELYPEAKLLLHGTNPFESPHADLSSGQNRIFPVPAALLAVPLTVLTVGAASYVFMVVLFAMIAATAWVAGVRDWRVYGLLALWPANLAAVQSGNLTLLLALLVAVAWHYRERRYIPGLAIGATIALKLFLWPLLVWLLALRAYRSAALGAAIGLAGGVLTALPFTSLSDFVQLENNLAHVFGPQSYNLVGLLVQSGASYRSAEVVADLVGLAALALAYRRRSLPLAVSAALLLSPIVWLHYFALLIVPIAARAPRLALIWFIPLLLWVCPGTAGEIREWHIVLALSVLSIVTVLAEWGAGPFRRAERRLGFVADGATSPGP